MNNQLQEAISQAILAKLKNKVEEIVISAFNEDNLEFQFDDLREIINRVFEDNEEGEMAEVSAKLAELLTAENLEKMTAQDNFNTGEAGSVNVDEIADQLLPNIVSSADDLAHQVIVEWHSTYGTMEA